MADRWVQPAAGGTTIRSPRDVSESRALVLAFDEAFARGAKVCLYSFLRYNPWFQGRVICVVDAVSPTTLSELRQLFPIEVLPIAPELVSASRRTARQRNLPADQGARLYSLQLFQLPNISRAVFLDADTVCLGDVSELFEVQWDLAAGPDLQQLTRACRVDPSSTSETESEAAQGSSYSFNSGVISVSARCMSRSVYEALLQLPGFEVPGARHRLGDQLVLNYFFRGRVQPLSPRYNFIVSAQAIIRELFGVTLADARVLHFAGYLKPWQISWNDTRACVPPEFLRYYDCWHELNEAMHPRTGRDITPEYHRSLEALSLATARARTRRR